MDKDLWRAVAITNATMKIADALKKLAKHVYNDCDVNSCPQYVHDFCVSATEKNVHNMSYLDVIKLVMLVGLEQVEEGDVHEVLDQK